MPSRLSAMAMPPSSPRLASARPRVCRPVLCTRLLLSASAPSRPTCEEEEVGGEL